VGSHARSERAENKGFPMVTPSFQSLPDIDGFGCCLIVFDIFGRTSGDVRFSKRGLMMGIKKVGAFSSRHKRTNNRWGQGKLIEFPFLVENPLTFVRIGPKYLYESVKYLII